jgi:precorrin-6B methylase 2
VRESDVVFDVGCADGRIAMTAVKKFNVKKAVGIDANPDRIASALKAAANLGGAIEFRRKDLASLTEKDLAEATVITIDNASEKLLADLAPILKKLKVGTRIVTHEFEIPGMRRDDKREKTVDGLDHVIYLYTVR